MSSDWTISMYTISMLGLIMYILTTFEFPKHNHDFHLLTTSVNAKYYYLYDVQPCYELTTLTLL